MGRVRREGADVGPWHGIIRGAQGNFDHLMGVIRRLASGHNALVDDVGDLRDFTEEGLADTSRGIHTHTDTSEGHDGGPIYAPGIDHGGLAGLADDDHTQYIKHSEADAVGDLLVGSADNDFNRLPKGTDGQVLKTNSAATLDLEWGTDEKGVEFDKNPQEGVSFLHADGPDYIRLRAGNAADFDTEQHTELYMSEGYLALEEDTTGAGGSGVVVSHRAVDEDAVGYPNVPYSFGALYLYDSGGETYMDLYAQQSSDNFATWTGVFTSFSHSAQFFIEGGGGGGTFKVIHGTGSPDLLTLDANGNLSVFGTIDGGTP
jgi:hypothetical protein